MIRRVRGYYIKELWWWVFVILPLALYIALAPGLENQKAKTAAPIQNVEIEYE